MGKKNEPTRLEQYQAYWAKADGLPRTEFNAPCCGHLLKARRPGEGEHWDTMMQCVFCDELFHLSLDRDAVLILYRAPESRKS